MYLITISHDSCCNFEPLAVNITQLFSKNSHLSNSNSVSKCVYATVKIRAVYAYESPEDRCHGRIAIVNLNNNKYDYNDSWAR